ncbi:MAG TPA: hypothetical protein VGK84_08925 [Candidatus Tumulicola sp.]
MLSGSRMMCAAFMGGVLLVGCAANGTGSPAVSSAASNARAAHSWMLPEATTDNLLYVSDLGSANLMVYSYYPNGLKFVGEIGVNPVAWGECVDANQNIWVTAGAAYSSFVLYRYPHGATTPDAVLSDPAGAPYGCAVDPHSGNLAVAATSEGGKSLPLAVYKKAAGRATLYEYPFLYARYLTYDGKGNLFVVGEDNDDSLLVVELPRGGKNLVPITISQRFDATGGIAWDGKYLAIADAGAATIYRFKVTGSTATEVGSLPVRGADTIDQLTVDGNRVIVPSNLTHQAGAVSIYRYPAGGNRLRTLRNFSQPYAAVVSRAPKS